VRWATEYFISFHFKSECLSVMVHHITAKHTTLLENKKLQVATHLMAVKRKGQVQLHTTKEEIGPVEQKLCVESSQWIHHHQLRAVLSECLALDCHTENDLIFLIVSS
jgi:hypothetical protein